MTLTWVDATGKTVEEAVETALARLGVGRDQVKVEVLGEGSRGLFGLIRAKQARVRVTLLEPEALSPDVSAEETKEDNEAEARLGMEFLDELLGIMGITAAIEERRSEESIILDVSGKGLGCLIGRHGETLDAIQYLTNLAASRRSRQAGYKSRFRFVVDIEGYREKRENTLKEMALRTASAVRKDGRSQILEPMSAADRRVVHMALQDVDGVTTYSEGEEPYRRIVIAPK